MAKHKKYHDGQRADMMDRSITGKALMSHGAMLKEDRSKPSNLPQEVMMKEYPEQGYFNSYIDDSIYGIDEQHNAGVNGMKKQIRSRMF
jgi:hypothetical protein